MDNLELLELVKFRFNKHIRSIVTNLPNRITVNIDREILLQTATYLFREHGLRFIISSALDNNDNLEIYYHFSKDDSGMIMNIMTTLPYEDPVVDSLVPLFVAADWIEREMHELFGIYFTNHPNLSPLLSEGNWAETTFPFRKVKQPKDKH